MPRETLLAGAAAGVLALALLAAAVVPAALASPADDRLRRPGPVALAGDVAVSPVTVRGATADLRLRVRLGHRGNPTPNVTVRFRAYDAESGMLATERTVRVGTLRGDGGTPVNATLTVERQGGYVVETTVFRGDERVARGRTEVSGLGALTPAYARTPVGFTESDVVPPLAVSVAEAGGNRTTLRVAASLTNAGGEAGDDLRVEFVLRQAESNLVAARASATVGRVRPGRTVDRAATVTVPAGYNYYVDAALYRDGVLVDTARSVANLDPTETITANETRREVEFRVEDFERDGERTGTPAAARAETAAPGFTAALAVVALLAAAQFARRTHR